MATTTPTTPKTLLEATNQLLKAIRVSAVMGLEEEDLNADASAAKQALDEVSVEVQSTGWFFNTMTDAKIDPNVDGSVSVPQNCLKFRSARSYSGARLVERGDKLFNPNARTFIIGETVTADYVEGLVFEELPAVARNYITAVAARRFCIPRLPATSTFRFTEEMVAHALSALHQMDDEQRDDTLLETSPHFAKMGRR
jgi:hypothetical protein